MKMQAWLIAVVLFPFTHGGQTSTTSPLPIVLWHGMGDFKENMDRFGSFIEKYVPGAYIKSLRIGSNMEMDIYNGFFMNINQQVDDVCRQLAADDKLKKGYNALGFSQGGQFLRAVAQRCPSPPMNNLISFGGQHQGVNGLPYCKPDKHMFCEYVRKLLDLGAYTDFVQKSLVQAQYWNDPLHRDTYLKKSLFLADINNERSVKNETYKKNLKMLNKFVMVRFTEDEMVVPIESEWFGYYAPGQDKVVLPMNQTQLYKEDWLGLKEMNGAGKLHFLTSKGNHLQFTKGWFIKNIIPFLTSN